MGYTKAEILKALKGENVKFLRLQITDILGVVKNVEVPSPSLRRPWTGRSCLTAPPLRASPGLRSRTCS